MRSILLAAAALVFMAAQCDDNLALEDFDENENNRISQEEFVDEFTDHYDQDWDYNDDGILDDEDFYVSSYSVWDADGDEYLTEDEFYYGDSFFFGDYVGDFDAVDLDNDNYVVYDEYHDALYDTEIYTTWDFDQNNEISDEELAENIFNNWDADNNGYISQKEYEQFDTYYAGL